MIFSQSIPGRPVIVVPNASFGVFCLMHDFIMAGYFLRRRAAWR